MPDTKNNLAPRLLVVGATSCVALGRAIEDCERRLLSKRGSVQYEPRLASARLRLETGERFDATLLLVDQPHVMPRDAAECLDRAGAAGKVVTIAGPWFEGRLRFQGAAGDPSIVYWHALDAWIDEVLPQSAAVETKVWNARGRCVLVASRDRDAAAAIADQFGDQLSVVWTPRGGRAPFVSRADAGVWIGGQLDGHAATEFAAFCKKLRPHGGPVVALLDFPRQDEVDTARAIGATAVLAKPWKPAALVGALRPALTQGLHEGNDSFLYAA